MTPLFRKFLGINWILFFTMLGVMIFGILAIYSASWMREDVYLQNSWNRQVIFMAIGLVIFFATALIDYRWILWGAVPMYIGGIGALVAVKFVGDVRGGARSWIDLGPLNVQPSQLAIVSGILVLALILSELPKLHPFFRHALVRMFLCAVVTATPFLLILKEPDVGSASVWGPVLVAMLLVGNIPFRYLAVIGLLALMALPLAYYLGMKDYQRERIDIYLKMLTNREVDTRGAAWTSDKAQMALGSAGWSGKGFKAEGSINELYLPETVAINDFVFAVIGEEHGFRGAMILLFALVLLLMQCLFVAFYSRDSLGRLIVVGLVGMMFVHIFMNVGMNITLVPITGLPLPLVSYGGTFVVIVLFLFGLVQSVWIHRNYQIQDVQSGVGT